MLTESPFCEFYQQGRYLPEWYNCISSLSFCFVSLFLYIFSSTSKIKTGGLLLSSLFFTGISSFLFHYNLWLLFGNMDVVSVLFLSHIGSYVILEITKTFNFFSLCTTISLWFARSPDFNSVSLPLLVVIPQFTVLLSILYYNITYLRYRQIRLSSIVYMNIGLIVLVLSASVPVFFDPLCQITYVRTHALWHIGSSYGIHLLTQAFYQIKSDSTLNFRTDSFVFLLLPCVVDSKF